MKISAIVLARFVAFMEPLDLNPVGKVYLPDIIPAIVAKYKFLKFPQKPEDLDESKGITFEGGRFEGITIQRIQLFTHVVSAETASSTTDSERVLEGALQWTAETFGLNYRAGMVKRKAHVSQLTFYSDSIFKNLNPVLLKIATKLSERVPQYFGTRVEYQPSSFAISYDPLTVKNGTSVFSIEPRAETPYDENKFFSTAPLPTEEHIKLLEELESDLQRDQRPVDKEPDAPLGGRRITLEK
jgi:hypothetical protein